MSKYIYCDFESQSTIDLKKQGSKVYIQHPHTRIMSGVFIVDNKVTIWVPKHIQADLSKYPLPVDRSADFPAHILQLAKTHTFVAHNAELFDKWLIEEKYPYRFNWLDTIHYCRAAGLPGGLGKVLDILFGINKLDNLAMLMLCEAKVRNGKPVYPVGNFAIWKKMLDYNVQDVKHLPRLMEYLQGTGVIEAERENVAIHESINRRGFKIDRELVLTLRKLWGDLQVRAVDEVSKLTDGALTEKDLFSPAKVKAYLQSLGYAYNTLNAQMVTQIIARPEDFLDGDDAVSMLALLVIRKNAIRATPGKLDRILMEIDEDDVARRSIIHYGAHTGRATGRGINPLNFPRGTNLIAPKHTLEGLLCNLQNGGNLSTITEWAVANSNDKVTVNEGDILNTLTRNCLIPHGDKFNIADLNAIEARGVGWLAQSKPMMDAFNDPKRDIYCEMATALFGRPITPKDETERFLGKTITLGCIAKGTPVLTDMGWKNIETVTRFDKVWDGEFFVECDGAIAKGRKLCYNVSGVWMTPDHKVLTDKGWVESCQLQENTHSQPKGWYSEDLRFNLLNLENGEELKELLQLANVEPYQDTTSTTCNIKGLRNATIARRNQAEKLSLNTWKSSMTINTGIGSSIEFARSTQDAIIRKMPGTSGMGDGASKSSLKLERLLCSISHLYRDGMIQRLQSTGSTTMETMRCKTYVLQRNTSSKTIKETYDILNAGPNQRFQTKGLIVHNCGYQMGHAKFEATSKIYGIDLGKVGVTAKQCVDTYRKTYPEVKRLWHKLEDACKNAVECKGIEFEAGRSKFKVVEMSGINWLRLTLPSKRNLWYRDVSVDNVPAPWNDQERINQVHYTNAINFRRSLYGGILAENICQAMCRDLLYAAMCKLQKTCLHTYDEIAGEDDLELLLRTMSNVPSWAKGFPIRVEGFSSPRYTKQRFANCHKMTAINGVLV